MKITFTGRARPNLRRRFKTSLSIFFITFLLIPFQNCSEGFKVGEVPNAIIDSSVLSAPQITFSSIPEFFNTGSVTLNFQLSIPAATVTCQLDSQPAQSCAGLSVTYSGASFNDGNHTLLVVATSATGARSEAMLPFTKDTGAPTVMVSSMPPSMTNQQATSFVFTATDVSSGVLRTECSLDNAAFAPCVSPHAFTAASGPRNFRIRAIDRAMNVSNIYSYNWTVDLNVPTVMLTAMPQAVTNQTAASFSFSGSGIVSYECSLNGSAFAACTSPRNYAAGDLSQNASNTFRVRGTNGSGVVSAIAQHQWVIDSVAPSMPTLTANVSALTTSRNASISFSSTDALSGVGSYQCATSAGGAFSTCTSPRALTNLADGSYVLRVRALDQAGNTSNEGSFSWTVDGTAPTLAFTQSPAASTTSTSAIFAFSASDANLSTVQCSLNTEAFANCTSPVTRTVAVGSHSFRVQARDTAGNMTTISHAWTVTSGNDPTPTGPVYYFSDCQSGAASSCVPGNNSNPGTSAAAPKRDLTGFNHNTAPAGTQLLFNRGGSWNQPTIRLQNMNTTAANPLVFGAYGTGPLPIFNATGDH